MSLAAAVRVGYRRQADFAGRSGRAHFWFWMLYQLLAYGFCALLALLAWAVGERLAEPLALALVWSVVHLVANLSAIVRRLHDRDLSGLWALLLVVPLLGKLALFVLAVGPGTPGPNRFGPDPRGESL